jgi:hypothetical protein
VKSLPGWMLVGAVIGGLTVGLWLEGRTRERIGVWKEKVRVADSAMATWTDTVRITDSVYVVDSTAFRSYATRYYRLRDSLASFNKDSGYVRDGGHPLISVPDSGAIVPVGGTPLLALCDSTVRIAEIALSSCAARVKAGDSLLAATRARLTLEQKKPGPRRFPAITAGAFVTPQGEIRVGIGVGVRIF